MQSRWWDFGADTVIRADQYIRLTADRPSQAGWIFSRVPLTATNWEVYTALSAHSLNFYSLPHVHAIPCDFG